MFVEPPPIKLNAADPVLKDPPTIAAQAPDDKLLRPPKTEE